MKILLILLVIFGFCPGIKAQDSAKMVQKQNILKLEISHLLYPNSMIFSWERVTKPNQSFSISAGYEEFPSIVGVNSNIYVKEDRSKSGFKGSLEYRFYLKGENKHPAPHGTYLGPYFSYHDFYNERNIEVTVDGVKESAVLEADFRVVNLGFQLGHQFLFGNRWALDVVAIGPSVSNYYANLKLNGEFTFDEEEIKDEILLKLLDRFPMLGDLLSDKEVDSDGKFDSWAFGWRAQCHIGYYFGRKKGKKG